MKFSAKLQLFNAGLCGLLGLLSSFLPQEILTELQLEHSDNSVFLIKALGAFYISWALLNYMIRNLTFGGVYGRPITAANLTHYGIGAILLIKEALNSGGRNTYLFLFITLYCLMSLAYLKLLQHDPTKTHQV